MNKTAQRICVWTGPAMLALWAGSWVFVADFIPPIAPGKSAAEVAEFYRDHIDGIRVGMILGLFASALLAPFAVVIAAQMRRIEGPRAVLSQVQLLSGALLSLEFIVPIMVFQAAAYRIEDQSDQVIQGFNDLGWLLFVGVISTILMQVIAIGIVVLIDRREKPIFPRWVGYFNLWMAVGLFPAGLVPLVKDGPFAWNGALSFYIPLTAFALWIIVMTWVMLRVVNDDELEDSAPRDARLER